MIRITFVCIDCKRELEASPQRPNCFYMGSGVVSQVSIGLIDVPKEWSVNTNQTERCPACYQKWLMVNQPIWDAKNALEKAELTKEYREAMKDVKSLATKVLKWKEYGFSVNRHAEALAKAMEGAA